MTFTKRVEQLLRNGPPVATMSLASTVNRAELKAIAAEADAALTAKDAEIVELRKDSLAYALAAERAAHEVTKRERDKFHGMYLRVEADRDTLKAENARLKAKLETS